MIDATASPAWLCTIVAIAKRVSFSRYTADPGRTLRMSGPKGEGRSMGWDALEHWGEDVARIEPLAGGIANDM